MRQKKNNIQNKQSYSNRNLEEQNKKRVARGEDMYGYGEQKKKLNLTLTPTAIALLTEIAKQKKLSRSEVLEQLLRKHLNSLVTLVKEDI